MTHEDGTTPLNHLVKVLRLGDPSEYRGHTYISGESLYFPTGRVYGGQVIAQSLIAASKTVSPSRLPHSVHGYFIAAGDIRRICCSTWRPCGTAGRSRRAGST